MTDLSRLHVGLKGRAEFVVTDADTAVQVGSGNVPVLATPRMIALMEAAAVAAVEDLLPPDHNSLGTRLEVAHRAATPAGLRVEATAELTAIEGRTLTFRVEARDAVEVIGDGLHVRAVVDRKRFDTRLRQKALAV